MYYILIFTIIGLFLALLALNIYFRIRVLKHYKYLVQNKVQFNAMDIFNQKKIDEEIVSKYPQHKEHILAFTGNIRRSVNIAVLFVVLIACAGAVLHFYR